MPIKKLNFNRTEKFIYNLRRILIISISIILFFVGFVGLILPVIPGIPFVILGLLVWLENDEKKLKILKEKFYNYIEKILLKLSNIFHFKNK